MPNNGTLEVWYKFNLRGICLSTPVSFSIPSRDVHATLSERDDALELFVQVGRVAEKQGRTVASRLAGEIYHRLLLKCAEGLELAVPPKLARARFTSADGGAVLTERAHSGDALIARPVTILPEPILRQLAADVEDRFITPQLPTSAPLYEAITMYSMALQSESKVVRFLILYSALSLAALFKFRKGAQRKVDELLQGVNPGLSVTPTSKKRPNETLYTKLRNDFLHAEEREWDVGAAINAIEKHLDDFQKDAAKVLGAL
jgi:hypothetical protein